MKNKQHLLILLLLFPLTVSASSSDSFMPIGMAIFMEAFVSIHMSVFVLMPISMIIKQDKEAGMKLFIKLFAIRAVVLLFFDIFVTTAIAMVDFLAVFFGAFIVVPVLGVLNKSKNKDSTSTGLLNVEPSNKNISGISIICTKCNHPFAVEDNFCKNCGAPFEGNNVSVVPNNDSDVQATHKIRVTPTDFDPIYSLPDDKLLEEFIKKEMEQLNITPTNLIPKDAKNKKIVQSILFSVLLFVFISMIFFHFPLETYVVGLIILIVLFIFTNKYDLIKYLKKQIKSRPSEKISSIIMNANETLVTNDTKKIFIIGTIIAIIIPLFIFYEPRIMYEELDDGYSVRFYTFGLKNYKTATIPETYNNKPVISLRGNTFSNMLFLESVTLPDTITEIRGQAFKNDNNLTKVNIPKNLKYLGGGAFYNCSSLKSIELPDTLTEMGGETFYGASSLESIKLSNNLKEIRGNSFENCISLKEITIPSSVTRIGGHAFYGNTSLAKVTFQPTSKLEEIGSSAFRGCRLLYEITLPKKVYINERAFKESPTVIKYFGNESYDYNYDYNYNYNYN